MYNCATNVTVMFVLFYLAVMFRKGWRYLRICYAINLRLSVVLLFVVMAVGEVGCFFWVYFTWRIPAPSSDSLNLLLVSDSQIQVSLLNFSLVINISIKEICALEKISRS